ncbi:MAG: FlhB HrpN YscU SpaS Family protein [Oscillospiraceae bacterium]|jgi:flagellar biosynthesis protein
MSPFKKLQKAAALKYNQSSDSAPIVVASGMGSTAREIVNLAEQNGVPVFRDDSLATLLSKMNAGTQIPPELYQAIVDIYVYFLGFHVDANGNVTRKDINEENKQKKENEE